MEYDSETSAYEKLAAYYDDWQTDVDHEAFADYLHDIVSSDPAIAEPQGNDGKPLWLDLGCGTAELILSLDDRGYDCIGIDNSEAMLMEANQKVWSAGRGQDILLSKQDIRQFELYGSVNVISIVLDTVNHLPDRAGVLSMLKCCRYYLHPGGLLIFDVLTDERASKRLADKQFFVVDDAFALFWSNQYNLETKRNRAEISLFEAQGRSGLYKRHELLVEEQIYSHDEILQMLQESGFVFERVETVDAGFGRMNGGEEATRKVYFAR